MKQDFYEEYDRAEEEEAVAAAEPEENWDEEAYAYTDEEHMEGEDLPEKTAGQDGLQKSAERKAKEARFLELYEEFMRPTKTYSAFRIQCQTDDLYQLLYELNAGWAYRKAKSYRLAGFREAEGEYALSIGCAPLYDLLKQDRAQGNYCDYPIGHYLRIAQNKAIDDYFRHEFGRLSEKDKNSEEDPTQIQDLKPRKRKSPHTISLDEPWSHREGRYQGERLIDASVDPFAEIRRPRREREEKAECLQKLFLRELMDYPNDPPQPLAVMYGRVLFQLYKEYGGEDELSRLAKKSPKVSSPQWAHRRMGNLTLQQLGACAQRCVQKAYDKSLTWGSDFNRQMGERPRDGSAEKWADVVYTKTYTESNTSKWIESISASTEIRCSRKMKDKADLREYAMETLGAKNRFRKALEKMEEEERR